MKRLLIALSFLAAVTLTAADYTWTGAAGDGNYDNPLNWTFRKIPSANNGTETVYLTEEGAGTINFDASKIRLKALVFLNSTPYTFSGNGINIGLVDGITLGSGDVTLHGVQIAGGTLQVDGPGKLYISNPVADATTVVPLDIRGTGKVILTGRKEGMDEKSPQTYTLSSEAYLGYTENFATSFAEFLQSINAITDPNAIVGIDSVDSSTTRTVSDTIDLSLLGRTEQTTPYYIGTTSNINLTGLITPTLTAGGGYDALYLAALDDGYLKISSQLGGSTSQVNTVVIGKAGLDNQGTVEIAASNSYSGGTRVLGGTLFVNTNNALGATSGTVSVSSGATLNLGSSASVSLYNPVVLDPGSTITGYGNYLSHITLSTGANLVPGGFGRIGEIHFHSPGTSLTLEAGAIWHVDLTATSSDRLCAWNNIDILGNRLVPIVINLYSVNSNGFGPLLDFDYTQSYTWTILSRNQSLTGFDPDYFNINADALLAYNPKLAGLGDFNIEQIGNDLAITFTPVPEPGTYALMLLGLATMGVMKYRRRKKV
ncbi:autotransporter-associated beta strand protein [Ereboglobus sp. PH5-5]|uniref:PEP-CTERM sorting domain-containing protein n=1 Tax=unclassified Ereboglobus TaxID=2626932 RepID=UPI0024073517|nr:MULTISPECIES: PEP-CTERM sorting domain-containing protein [unclassified Ereboglobus]MDF9825990.1 autotransporter-associated beta strand protein [Ereboglobus sp. PH5-10]MDF9833254.1 autotransporter-associated beta strand protein [Ereboglobus sp. PH5-5]